MTISVATALAPASKLIQGTPVNPHRKCTVLILPIKTALQKGLSVYEATRASWRFSNNILGVLEANKALAVGVADNLAVGVFDIIAFDKIEDEVKFKFTGNELAEHELLNTDFTAIISKAGSWKRGNYLVVKFYGNGKYKYLYGHAEQEAYFDLI